jgi:hypothetical protein
MSQATLNRPAAPQTIGGQNVHSGMMPKREGRTVLKGGLMAASIGVGLLGAATSFFPVIGNMIAAPVLHTSSYLIDRVKNGVETTDELKFRAKYYSPQIFKTLGIRAREGQVADEKLFKKAAEINPELSKLYNAPLQKEKAENRSSFLTNGGIMAAGALIPGGGAVGTVGKQAIEAVKTVKDVKTGAHIVKSGLQTVALVGSGVAGGAIANAISGEVVDPQQLLEGIHKTVVEAKAHGINMREVVSPNLIFMLRVSQDEQFAKAIKEQYKKPFHQMNEGEQTQVMSAFPALANAATSEAYAVANGILQVQELGASKPNLNAIANQYAVGARNSSFATRLQAQRAAAPQGFGATV